MGASCQKGGAKAWGSRGGRRLCFLGTSRIHSSNMSQLRWNPARARRTGAQATTTAATRSFFIAFSSPHPLPLSFYSALLASEIRMSFSSCQHRSTTSWIPRLRAIPLAKTDDAKDRRQALIFLTSLCCGLNASQASASSTELSCFCFFFATRIAVRQRMGWALDFVDVGLGVPNHSDN